MILEVKDGNLEEIIKEGVALVDLWAPWCGPCRVLGPIVDGLAVDLEMAGSAIKVAKMNVDENRDVAVELGVTSIPTILIYKDGVIVDRAIGVTQKPKLMEMLEKYTN